MATAPTIEQSAEAVGADWTPGPWFHGKMYGWGGAVCITRRPADDYGPTGRIGDAPLAVVIEKAPHWENSHPFEANARLMAAAPALYDALEMAAPLIAEAQEALCGRDDVCTTDDGEDALHLLRNVIDAALRSAKPEQVSA